MAMQTYPSLLTVLAASLLCSPVAAQDKPPRSKPAQKPTQKPAQGKQGYTNTPVIPGQKWRVHDADRPHPKIIRAGTASTEAAAGKAPSDAVVLFGGKNLDGWKGRKGDARWLVKDGHFECNRTGPITTRQEFGDCQLHVEWRTPLPVKGKSQGRGNSGIFLMGRYEIQVLDSYQNITYADGQAGAIYGQTPPLVNACRGPGTWQSYDIIFQAPRFSKAGKVVSPAFVTVLHNGVLLHHHRALIGATTHKKVGTYKAHGPKGSIQLQDHGNPIRYRNIWVRELKGYDRK
jgi:3-keto-disaccharide hydrolase